MENVRICARYKDDVCKGPWWYERFGLTDDNIYCFFAGINHYRIEHFHLDLAEGSVLFDWRPPWFPLLSVVIRRTIWAGTLIALLSPPGPPRPSSALTGTEVILSVSEFFLLWRTVLAMSSNRESTWSPDFEDVSTHLQPSWIALVWPASLLTWVTTTLCLSQSISAPPP